MDSSEFKIGDRVLAVDDFGKGIIIKIDFTRKEQPNCYLVKLDNTHERCYYDEYGFEATWHFDLKTRYRWFSLLHLVLVGKPSLLHKLNNMYTWE